MKILKKRRKVVLITNMMSPYRIPLFNKIAERNEFDFKVYFMKEREFNRKWNIYYNDIKFNFSKLRGFHIPVKKKEWEIHFNMGIFLRLSLEKPDVIILGGYDSLTCWIALFYAKLFSRCTILWSGSVVFNKNHCKNHVGIRDRLKKFYIRYCDAFIAYGTKAQENLQFLGAEKNSIFRGCNVGDIDFYRNWSCVLRDKEDFILTREKYPQIIFVCVSRLIEQKGILKLLEAFKKIKKNNIILLIIGEGQQYNRLLDFCVQNGLKEKVKFIKFKQKQDIVKYYALADVFILPSLKDCFSIVVSEALASGLFTLVSKYDGAAYDLLKEGINGYIFDPYDVKDIKDKIEMVVDNFSELSNRTKISQSISTRGVDFYADKFIKAVNYTIGNKK
ncbi:glycosyltransferase family 4 protein [bacterium]|nr:glycosyltransferase family 4 protein [bacterium]